MQVSFHNFFYDKNVLKYNYNSRVFNGENTEEYSHIFSYITNLNHL
jgi:hypothetical protein